MRVWKILYCVPLVSALINLNHGNNPVGPVPNALEWTYRSEIGFSLHILVETFGHSLCVSLC